MSIRRLHAYLLLLAVAVIWGLATPIVKFTLRGISPFPFLAYRFTVTAIFGIGIIYLNRHQFRKYIKHIIPISIYGVLATSIALGALFLGLDESSVLDTNIIGTLNPLLVTLGGAYFFHDHITHKEKLGVLIAVIGTFIATFWPIFASGDTPEVTGNIFLIIYLLADVVAILMAKRLLKRKVPPLLLTSWAFILGAITMVPFAAYYTGTNRLITQISQMDVQYHLGVIYMAVMSGLVAYTLLNKAEKTIEVSEAGLFAYLHPVFSVPLAILWLGETITPHFVLGAAVIATGVYIAEAKTSSKHRRHI